MLTTPNVIPVILAVFKNHSLGTGLVKAIDKTLLLVGLVQVADCCVRLMECSRDLSVSLFMDMS